MKKRIQKLIHLLLSNYFLTIFIVCCVFVLLISVYKLFIQKPTYVYVKVKVGQGLWWASTQKPSMWLIEGIKHIDEERDLTGSILAQVLNVSYYPWYGSSQYDVYVTMKLKVSQVGKSGLYNFKRATIGVASPVDFEFPNIQFSGTIIQLSDRPITEKIIQKTVYLVKKYSSQWEYDAIEVGDTYNNGNKEIMKILDKTVSGTNQVILAENGKFIDPNLIEERNYILVKTKMTGYEKNGQFIFAEEFVITPGRLFDYSIDTFTFNGFVIAQVE